MPDSTVFTDLHDTMRVLLGDRQVHGVWNYDPATLNSALRSVFIAGRQPTGYRLVGSWPTATELEPELQLGDHAALLIYDACLALAAGEDGGMSFTTRSLSVNDRGDRKRDLLWELRARIEDIRSGGCIWSTVQSLTQFVGALPHERGDQAWLEQRLGQAAISVSSVGEIVI